MKKILKNASLLLITLVFSFGFVKNAYADCTGATYGSDECRETPGRTIWVAGNAYYDYPYRPLKEATYTRRSNIFFNSDNPNGGDMYHSIGVTGASIYSGLGYPISKDSFALHYCLDAQFDGYYDLWAERFLGTIDNRKYEAQDYAFLYVLTGGGNNVLTSVSSRAQSADYWARLTALRWIGYTFGSFGDSNTDHQNEFDGARGTLGVLLNSNSQYYDKLNSLLNNSLQSKSYFASYTRYAMSGAPVEQAISYYNGALNAAAYYLETLAGDADVDVDSVDPIPTEVTKTETGVNLVPAPGFEVGEESGETTETIEGNGSVLVQKDVVHTIKVSGMPNDGENEFIINDITLEEPVDGLTYYIKSIQIGETVIEDQETIKSMLGQNLLSDAFGYDFTDDTTILITAHFDGYESSDDPNVTVLKCGQAPIKYYIDGSYKAGGRGLFDDYTGVVWYSSVKQTQRYVSVEEGGATDGDTWTSPYETYLVDACNCDDLIEACIASGSMESDECQELLEADCGECAELEVECALGDQEACEEYGAVCEVECPTTVSNFDCCDANNNMIISTADDHEVDILGPEDVRACFVSQIDAQVEQNGSKGAIDIAGAKDDVDNSYSLYDIKDQNKYCHVSCKEDYMMTMPTAKLVNAGRYFTFKAAVDGTKTCYTNTIDRDLYNEDILAAQVELIEAYNNFKDWEAADKAAKENINSTYTSSVSPSGCSCNGTTSNYISGARTASYTYDYFYITDSSNKETGVVIGYMGTSSGQKSVSSITHSVNGGSYSGCSFKNPDGTCQSTCNGDCYYTVIDEEKDIGDLEEYIAGELSSAKSRLKAAQEAYEAVIDSYNACSEWNTEINYSPDVYYDYEESYLTDMYNNRGEMDSTITSEGSEEWYCNSNVSSSGNETQAELSDKTYETCSLPSSSGVRYTSINYIYCDESSCTARGDDVSDARYKKIISNIKINYVPSTLFYNVYPSGEIVDREEGEGREDTVALENKLPVSLSTERGIYKYTVNMGNLGEYYDQPQDGNLGRLIDGEDSGNNPVINKQDYTDYVNEEGYVEYACSYLVNMGITDEDTIICDFDTLCTGDDCIADCIGPNCDYECDGEDCIADCIGAGCIYDSDAGSSMIDRVVSLKNLFPNGTDSYNWNRDENKKAKTTIAAIQEKEDNIYFEDPILSVTITPEVSRSIRAYNDEAEGNGGYSNSTLDCYDLGGYQEIACYSSFIGDILNGTYGEVVNDRSLILGNNYRTVGDNNTEYFTLWNGTISETDMLGPSWK